MSENKANVSINADNVDLDGLNPIPASHRTVSVMNYAMMFWSSTIIVQIMVIGLYLMPAGGGVLNFVQTLVVGILSALIITIVMTLNGDAGARYGVPYVMQARLSFGTQGSKIVGFIRSVPAICWNGVCTWIGALALRTVTQQIFGWGNVWVYFIALLIIQSYLSYRGIGTIKGFDATMSIVIFIMLIYFFIVVFASGKVDFTEALAYKGTWGRPFWAGVMGATANYTTVLLNSSDLIRHIKFKDVNNSKVESLFANMFGIIPPWMFMFLAGIIIALATGASDPIEGLVMLSPHPVFGIILLCFIVLAQVTSNLTLNITPVALAFQDTFRVKWRTGVILTAVLSVIVCPWVLYGADFFFVFQNIYSSFLGPICGVMLSDYYIFRKQNINIPELYEGSKYTYKGGFAPTAFIALICGAIISACFFDISWLVGMPSTFVIYTILKKVLPLEKKDEELQGIR